MSSDDDRRWVAERFREAWDVPQVDRFVALLHPDVRLLQPVTPTIDGRENAREEFRRLLRWLQSGPGLRLGSG